MINDIEVRTATQEYFEIKGIDFTTSSTKAETDIILTFSFPNLQSIIFDPVVILQLPKKVFG